MKVTEQENIPQLFRAFMQILKAFSWSSSVTLLVRRTTMRFFRSIIRATGDRMALRKKKGTQLYYVSERAHTSTLVIECRNIVVDGCVLIVVFEVAGKRGGRGAMVIQ